MDLVGIPPSLTLSGRLSFNDIGIICAFLLLVNHHVIFHAGVPPEQLSWLQCSNQLLCVIDLFQKVVIDVIAFRGLHEFVLRLFF